MATSPTQFISNSYITSSMAAIGSYAVPTSCVDKLYEFIFCNSHTAAVGITMHFVASGGSVANSNKILDSTSYVLQPGETRRFGLEQRLAAGATIHAQATVTNVISVHLAGDRVTP